jgi:hypothetical protein
LAAFATRECFFETPDLLIFQSQINKSGVSKNFILPLKTAEYFSHNLHSKFSFGGKENIP